MLSGFPTQSQSFSPASPWSPSLREQALERNIHEPFVDSVPRNASLQGAGDVVHPALYGLSIAYDWNAISHSNLCTVLHPRASPDDPPDVAAPLPGSRTRWALLQSAYELHVTSACSFVFANRVEIDADGEMISLVTQADETCYLRVSCRAWRSFDSYRMNERACRHACNVHE